MVNEKYSFKDFMGQEFSSVDASEFNNSEIVGSCFSQEGEPDTEIFPSGMTGVTFKDCNLDNVKVPSGNTIEGGCHRRVKVQNDLEKWLVDSGNNPVEPRSKAEYIRLGISIDPADIPVVMQKEPLTQTKMDEKRQADIDAVKEYDSDLAERLGL